MKSKITAVGAIIALAILPLPLARRARASDFIRADANLDGTVDLSDAIKTLGFLFLGVPHPGCDDAMDSDDSGAVDLTDAVYTLNWLFRGSAPPPAPFPECGADPSADPLDCLDDPGCVTCFDAADLDALLAENVPDVTCLPPDAASANVNGFDVTVCPHESAEPCGPEVLPGCPIEVTEVTGRIEIPARRAVVHVEGIAVSLPIVIVDPLFKSSTTCLNDIDFSADVIVPFATRPAGAGRLEVSGVDPLSVENVTFGLNSRGGLLCDILESQQDALEQEVTGQLEQTMQELLVDLEPELIGVILCPP